MTLDELKKYVDHYHRWRINGGRGRAMTLPILKPINLDNPEPYSSQIRVSDSEDYLKIEDRDIYYVAKELSDEV